MKGSLEKSIEIQRIPLEINEKQRLLWEKPRKWKDWCWYFAWLVMSMRLVGLFSKACQSYSKFKWLAQNTSAWRCPKHQTIPSFAIVQPNFSNHFVSFCKLLKSRSHIPPRAKTIYGQRSQNDPLVAGRSSKKHTCCYTSYASNHQKTMFHLQPYDPTLRIFCIVVPQCPWRVPNLMVLLRKDRHWYGGRPKDVDYLKEGPAPHSRQDPKLWFLLKGRTSPNLEEDQNMCFFIGRTSPNL